MDKVWGGVGQEGPQAKLGGDSGNFLDISIPIVQYSDQAPLIFFLVSAGSSRILFLLEFCDCTLLEIQGAGSNAIYNSKVKFGTGLVHGNLACTRGYILSISTRSPVK